MDFENGDFVVTGGADPVLCKTIQPWKDPSINDEDIILDLMGCILSLWNKYRIKFGATSYTQADAISDAYQGFLQAKRRDAKAPTFAGKLIDCAHCGKKYTPETLPGDERAHKIYKNAPADRVPTLRRIATWCPHCGEKNMKTVYKTKFSTCVFPYLRAAIQRGAYNSCPKKGVVSVDGFGENDDNNLLGILESKKEETNDSLPGELVSVLYEALDALSERQRIVLALAHGIGGIYNEVITKTVCCPECLKDAKEHETTAKKAKDKEAIAFSKKMAANTSFEVGIDYSRSYNLVECPTCGHEIHVDMSMSQTDIAKHLDVSKQRICSTLKSVISRLRGDINEKNVDYPLWKKLTDRLSALVASHEVI